MYKVFLFCFLVNSFISNAQIACSLDNTFDTDGKLVSDGSRMGESIIVLPDNKIIIACNPFGSGVAYLKKLQVNGSVDNTFGVAGNCNIAITSNTTKIACMKLYNSEIYICGTTSTGSNTYPFVAVVNANGTLKTSFGIGGISYLPTNYYTANALVIDKQGNILVCGEKNLDQLYITKISNTGVTSTTFGASGYTFIATGNLNHWIEARDITIDNEDKIVLCGKKYSANNGSGITPFWNAMIVRFTANGILDNTFAIGGIGYYNYTLTSFDETRNIHIVGNNYVVTGSTYNGVDYDYYACKVNNAGMLDNSFGTVGWSVHDLTNTNDNEYHLTSLLLQDGRILLGGNQGDGDTVHFSLLMLLANGTTDNVFAPNGFYSHIFNTNNNSSGSGLGIGKDGKIVMGGYTRTCANGSCGPLSMAVARYNNTYMNTPIQNKVLNNTINIYPNPIKTNSTIYISEPFLEIQILSLDGKEIQSESNIKNKSIQIHAMVKGTYICKIKTVQNTMVYKKINVE